MFGNERAAEQFDRRTKAVVKLLGIEDGGSAWSGSAPPEGTTRFAEVINEFTDQVRELGPSPLTSPAKQGGNGAAAR